MKISCLLFLIYIYTIHYQQFSVCESFLNSNSIAVVDVVLKLLKCIVEECVIAITTAEYFVSDAIKVQEVVSQLALYISGILSMFVYLSFKIYEILNCLGYHPNNFWIKKRQYIFVNRSSILQRISCFRYSISFLIR